MQNVLTRKIYFLLKKSWYQKHSKTYFLDNSESFDMHIGKLKNHLYFGRVRQKTFSIKPWLSELHNNFWNCQIQLESWAFIMMCPQP